jgi:hypothetical protein
MLNDSKASSNFWQEAKFAWFVAFSWMLLPGIALFVIALLGPTDWPYALVGIAGFLLMAPFVIHLNLLVIWHWKGRYLGRHSKLWGALLIFETTGWFRLIYFFRHVLADRRNSGRYRRMPNEPGAAISTS